MKKILTLLTVLIFSACMAFSTEVSLNYEEINPSMPQEVLPSAYQVKTFSKDETVLKSSKYHIDSIDPNAYTNRSGKGFPGFRGSNQLIIYTPAYGVHTNTNEFGAEAIVNGSTVVELSGADSFIPSNGLVVSGHGNAKNWINSNLKVGTKIYIDQNANEIYAYTTSESYIFETEQKIAEAEQIIQYYRTTSPAYNWKLPSKYIDDAKEYLKKAKRHPDNVQNYSQLAIENANDALKSVLPYRNGELKGVWLRPVEKSEYEITATLNRLQSAGFNNIFLETYYHGKTIFPSKTMKAYGFTPQYEQFIGFDPLAVWIREAHKRGIKVHIWFETFYTGNQNPQDNPESILAKNPSWANKTKKDALNPAPTKAQSEHNGYFLDPANPYVKDFLVKLLEEIITTYRPDGINVDYIRYPSCISTSENANWGYTTYAREDFKSIYGIDPFVLKKTDLMWKDWDSYRNDQVTDMVKKIGQLGRKTNTYISAVVFPDRETALSMKHQDWKTWTTREYVNGFTPLLLTCNSQMAHSMMQEIMNVKSPNTDLFTGLFSVFMNCSDEDLIRLIHESRKMKVNGVIIFDYAHLNNKYINTLSRSVFASSQTSRKDTPAQCEEHKGWWIFK